MDVRGSEVILVVRDPNIVEELYITKNKFTDKDLFFQELLWDLLKTSSVFSGSNEEWMLKRKKLTFAFYKEKLMKIFDKIQKITL